MKQLLSKSILACVLTALAALAALPVTATSETTAQDVKSAVKIEMEGNQMCVLPPTKARLDYRKVAPESFQAMIGLQKHVSQSGLEPSLLVLVQLRSSQINGCDYCLDMHAKEAHLQGETEQRLSAVSTWRTSSLFSERERAALAWTEAITRIADTHAPDDVYEAVCKQFSEKERVDLTLSIVAINGWNRLNIAFQTVPGS